MSITTTANFSKPAEEVIHVGVSVEQDYNDPAAKIYRSSIPESRTHMSDGREIVFHAGLFATSDPEVQKHLDALVKSNAAPVYLERDTIAEQFAQAAEGAAVPASQISEANKQLLAAASPQMTAATAAAMKPENVAGKRV